MVIFSISVFFLLITPGPGVLSLAGVGAAFGMRSGFFYLIGLWCGTNLVSIFVFSGFAALIFSIPNLRLVFSILSLLYLSYLGVRIGLSGKQIAFIKSKNPPGVIDGIALQLINPKAYAVNVALFSSFAFFPENILLETFVKLLLINIIWCPIHFFWLFLGSFVKKLNLPDHIQHRVNLAMATSMFVVVVLAILMSGG